jgi:hypothetical protein
MKSTVYIRETAQGALELFPHLKRMSHPRMSKQEGGPFVSEQGGQIPLCVLRARVVWCVRAVRV